MMSKIRLIHFATLFLTLISATAAFADVKIKTRSTADGHTTENTTYIKGKRQRTEAGAGEMVSLMQCDLRRTVQLAPQAKTYLINLFDDANAAQTAVTKTNGKTATTVVRGGTVTTIYTVKDTGERKQMFGYTARRVITTIETQPSPDACSQEKTKMEMDDWVVDAEFALVCDFKNGGGYVPPQINGCQDKYVVKNVGSGKAGYPVRSKMTLFGADGKPSFSSVSEVVELSKTTLDAALFEVPADYREVTDAAQLYAANNSTGASNSGSFKMPQIPGANASSSNNSGASVKNVSNEDGANVGAKKPGVVRLGLAEVKTGALGEGMNAQELAAAVGNTLADYLKMPNVEIVRLEARLPQAIDAEAREKECDFLIYASVAHKKGGGGFFGKALGKLSETVAGRAYGSSDTIGKAAQITIMTAAEASGNVKAKDQLTLDLKLAATGGASPVAKQFQTKAKSDGEDIITPLVEQAAQLIASAIAKK